MNRLLLSLALLAALATGPAGALDLQERVDTLSKEVAELREQIALLQSVLYRDASGNMTLTATDSRQDRVGMNYSSSTGANASETIGGDASTAIGKSTKTQIGHSRTVGMARDDLLKVGGSSTTHITANSNLNVGGSASQQVSGNLGITVAREILIQAGDQITLKTGSASIVLKKSGDIAIIGSTIQIRGSGDVVIKGSKVSTN